MAIILDLHWTAPGTQPATGQMPMPDMDHSLDFWTSVASTFKQYPQVTLVSSIRSIADVPTAALS
jgi:aryl-phospho-beta-D-glucosidase BglC (GH1 family)